MDRYKGINRYNMKELYHKANRNNIDRLTLKKEAHGASFFNVLDVFLPRARPVRNHG
ncbi:MAG: hypothetical protein BSOLF_1990 [Candidatus Carbobacillus altaicus]|uniref:Uncharacterized protein n=1 Tax=Candidatus Carbonibacillus altaicus TaxID=2163959 RepID=A0A2R6Y3L8_9BACL|nr:MAG: hypothetical protein BSOLF_1990 [Candidatus Carbobacillus altaicus]